ncbi:hypothetical protein Lser_V15G43051 [Lactuca serriola]
MSVHRFAFGPIVDSLDRIRRFCSIVNPNVHIDALQHHTRSHGGEVERLVKNGEEREGKSRSETTQQVVVRGFAQQPRGGGEVDNRFFRWALFVDC